jgi:hypothetical protein
MRKIIKKIAEFINEQPPKENDILTGKLSLYSETGTEGGYWALQDNDFVSLISPAFGVYNQKVWDINNKNRFGQVSNAEVYLNNEWLPLPDPIQKDPDYEISSLYCGEEKGDFNADKRLSEKYKFTIKYTVQRLNEAYGENNWKFDGEFLNSSLKDGKFNGKIPYAILSDGRHMSMGATPATEPNRPYGIPQNGLTKVTVEWNDGTVEHNRKSDTLLVESWSYEGLHILRNGDYLRIFHPTEKKVVWEGNIELKQLPLFSESANGLWIHADQKGISREEWSKYFFGKYVAELRKQK